MYCKLTQCSYINKCIANEITVLRINPMYCKSIKCTDKYIYTLNELNVLRIN